MGLFSKLTSTEAGRLDTVMFDALVDIDRTHGDDGTYEDTLGVLDDVRSQHPRVAAGTDSFHLRDL
jgi:hypothetical protein